MALSQGAQLGNRKSLLPNSYKKSILYHDIFDFPLTKKELIFWQVNPKLKNFKKKTPKIIFKNGFYFFEGKEGIIKKRLANEKFSKVKMRTATKAAQIAGKIPWIRMVGVTGSLAMRNAKMESDIDLMFITAPGTLWTSRILVIFLFFLFKFSIRRFGNKDEKDKLCLNIWLDESDLVWNKKNIFTAHEIAQIKPLINKDKTYERFIWKNKWAINFWPNAIKVSKIKEPNNVFSLGFIEKMAFKIQYWYMKSKITQETVTINRALFHPVDFSERIKI